MNASKELARIHRMVEQFRNIVGLSAADFAPHDRDLIKAADDFLEALQKIYRVRGIRL